MENGRKAQAAKEMADTQMPDLPFMRGGLACEHPDNFDKKPEAAKSKRLQHAGDSTKLMLPPKASISNGIGLLIRSYEEGGNPWCLSELENVLKDLDKDLTFRPLDNAALYAFTDAGDPEGEPFTQENADDMVKEALVAWPALGTLDSYHVYLLARGMRQAQVVLDYAHLKAFVKLECKKIRKMLENEDERAKATDNEELLGKIAQKTEEKVYFLLGSNEAPMANVHPSELLPRAIVGKLREMVVGGEDAATMLKEEAGNYTFGTSYQDIWSKYSDASDTDTARAAWMDGMKLGVAVLNNEGCKYRRPAEDLADILEKVYT